MTPDEEFYAANAAYMDAIRAVEAAEIKLRHAQKAEREAGKAMESAKKRAGAAERKYNGVTAIGEK